MTSRCNYRNACTARTGRGAEKVPPRALQVSGHGSTVQHELWTSLGPHALHSTGQLHKGGPDTGVFIQITSSDINDIEIPGEKCTFGVLKQAEALVTLGSRKAIAGSFRRPAAKPTKGLSEPLAARIENCALKWNLSWHIVSTRRAFWKAALWKAP